MRRSPSIVALLTDFGSHDHYVGTMKAVMLSVNPALHIVDITHDVEPHSIRDAAYLLWASYRYFPMRTIFVAVVDPGVGSARRILGVRTSAYTFLAPDNGLLDLVLSSERSPKVYQIDYHLIKRKRIVLSEISSTFHGRDIFAPLAAHMSLGKRLSSIGALIEIGQIQPAFVSRSTPNVMPTILHIDRFGNIITNIVGKDRSFRRDYVPGVRLARKPIVRWIRHYQEGPPQTACLIVGSSGLVEIVVKNASAAGLLGVDTSTPLRISRR